VWQKLAQSEHYQKRRNWIFLNFSADFNTQSVTPTSFLGILIAMTLTSKSIAAFVWLSFTLFEPTSACCSYSWENLSYTMKMGETLRYTMIDGRTVFGEKNTSITITRARQEVPEN